MNLDSLSETGKNLKALFDSIEDFVFVVGLDGLIIISNQIAAKRLGYTEEELTGKHVSMLHASQHREEVSEIMEDIAQGKISFCPLPLLTKDGVLIPVETRVTRGQWFETEVFFGISRDISNRMEVNKLLFLMQARLHHLIATSPGVTYSAKINNKADYSISFISRNIKDLIGYQPEEVTADFLFLDTYLHPDDKGLIFEQIMKLPQERHQKSEYRIRHKNGGYRWFYDERRLISDSEGNHLEVVGSFFDISKHKNIEQRLEKHKDQLEELVRQKTDELIQANRQLQAELQERIKIELELAESEKRYRELAERLPQSVFETNERGYFTFVNSCFLKVSEYSVEEINKLRVFDLIIPADRARAQINFLDTLQGKDMGGIEYTALTKTAKALPVFVHVTPYTFNGKVLGLRGIATDITPQKNKENLLQKREEQYRTLTEYSGSGIVLSRNGVVFFANCVLTSIFGYTEPGQLIGRKITELIHEDFHYLHKKQFHELHLGTSANNTFEGICISRNGCEFWIEAHNTLIKWEQESVVLSTIRDITKKKQRELAAQEEKSRLETENIQLRSHTKNLFKLGPLVGKSTAMQRVYESIFHAAASDDCVIVCGQSGTGKELVARTIHDMSKRSAGPFVPINCGAIPSELLESEFFGFRKGSFTGAFTNRKGYLDMADGGTLFLDEIGELEMELQVKLLRAIEGNGYIPLGSIAVKKPNIRIIAATNQNLKTLVQNGKMREDFFYRIHVLPIYIPPLNERKEDIPLLIEHFFEAEKNQSLYPLVPPELLQRMYVYDWPGNVRELQNVLKRWLASENIDLTALVPVPLENINDEEASIENLRTLLENYEKKVIVRTLERYRWHKSKSAAALGISRKTFFRKMLRYELLRA